MKFTHENWIITLPDDWTYDQEEECLSFYSPDESRSLHISDFFKEAAEESDEDTSDSDITLEDILELSGIEEYQKTNLPFMHGILHRTVDEGDVVLGWWLHMKNHLVFAEYICLESQEESLNQEIEDLIYSIKSCHC